MISPPYLLANPMVETVRYYQNITVIFSAQLLQCIIDFPFKGVHNYQGMLL